MLIHSPKELAEFIRHYRKAQKQSQTTVTTKVGIKQTTLSQFELHPQKSQLDTLFRILAALDLELHIENSDKASDKIKHAWKEKW